MKETQEMQEMQETQELQPEKPHDVQAEQSNEGVDMKELQKMHEYVQYIKRILYGETATENNKIFLQLCKNMVFMFEQESNVTIKRYVYWTLLAKMQQAEARQKLSALALKPILESVEKSEAMTAFGKVCCVAVLKKLNKEAIKNEAIRRRINPDVAQEISNALATITKYDTGIDKYILDIYRRLTNANQ